MARGAGLWARAGESSGRAQHTLKVTFMAGNSVLPTTALLDIGCDVYRVDIEEDCKASADGSAILQCPRMLCAVSDSVAKEGNRALVDQPSGRKALAPG